MSQIAFVGDIHGSIQALEGILAVLETRRIERLVFLGDYINKGEDSKAVLSLLIDLRRSGTATLLRGNHETALLHAIDEQHLSSFLKMGGASTIRSYINGNVGPDVLSEFTRAIPSDHVEAIRAMPVQYRTMRVLARHQTERARSLFLPRLRRFEITAHRPIGRMPKIDVRSAQIDTGCSDENGRLTAFLWPSRQYVQVDSKGARISED